MKLIAAGRKDKDEVLEDCLGEMKKIFWKVVELTPKI